jgi:energy-coupling factor transport system permease protein
MWTSNSLTRINPLLKLIACFSLITLTLFLDRLASLGLLTAVLLGVLRWQVPVPRPLVLRVGLALLMLWALSTWLLGSGADALHSILRLLAILLPAPILAGTTAPMDMLCSLQTVKLPGYVILSLMLIWRFLPLMQREAQRILEANRLRGIRLSRRPGQWFAGLLVPLIFQTVSYADEVTIGLQTRGYDPGSPRSQTQSLRWTHRDTGFCVGLGLLVVTLALLEWGLR